MKTVSLISNRKVVGSGFTLVLALLLTWQFITVNTPAANARTMAEIQTSSPAADAMLHAVLWTQSSGEAHALKLQAYELAKIRLIEALAEKTDDTRTPAIILDIDETLLDNSPQCAGQALTTGRYSYDVWRQWTRQANAAALPGAKAFLDLADAKGVAIFYISNRMEEEREDTLRNMSLPEVNFPQVDSSRLLLRQPGKSGAKGSRRDQVEKDHRVLLLVGDNLSDFSSDFDKLSQDARDEMVNTHAAEFGRRFIVLPNPMYGDWQGAILGHSENNMSDDEMHQRLRAHLR